MHKMLPQHLSWKKSLAGLPLVALLFSACGAFAAAPSVVVGAQLTLQGGLNAPQSLAFAPNNSYYVANGGSNQVLLYTSTTATASPVSTGGFTLVNPQAVAVDSLGDLFIGDSPTSGVGRVIEAHATGGVLNGTVTLVVSGGALKDVTALTVDKIPGSATFNSLYIGDDISQAIYSVAAGSTALVNLGITGLPSGILPTALLKDASGNLFVTDFFTTIYEVPSGTTTAQTYVIPGFVIYGPTGLALDPAGNLYILTLTSTSPTPSQQVAENVVEVPGGNVNNAFRIPITGLLNGSGLGIDNSGNVYEVDLVGNDITELIYGSPIGLSQVAVNSVGPPVIFNYELNAPLTLRGFRSISAGDTSTEVQVAGGNCNNGKYVNGSDGGPISTSDPFVCQEIFAAQPAYPGLRYGAIQLRGPSPTILAETAVFSTGIEGESVLYPLTATTGATGIAIPGGVAISGLDKKLYIVDSFTPQILSANGPTGKTLTRVSTAPVTLVTPLGIAVNGKGDLYVVDFATGSIVVVPKDTSQIPYTFNPGNLLDHPLSLAFDTLGNLFIADAGPLGSGSSIADPGYLVEAPVGGGAPFKINTGLIAVYYPDALAADPYTGDLLVGDLGYENATDGTGGAKVFRVPAGGGAAVDIPNFDGSQPVGIAFDPAEDYYVLDSIANTLTQVPPNGSFTLAIGLTSDLINSPNALAITNGGTNFVVANGNGGSTPGSNLIFLNGKASSFNFGTVTVGQQSDTANAKLQNIGNDFIGLGTPYYTSTRDSSSFDFLNSTTCFSGLALSPASPCNIFLQFVPSSPGAKTSTVTFQTSGFLPTSVLTLRGRGRR